MCKDSDTYGEEILEWSSTEPFKEVCLEAGMQSEEVTALMEELYSLPTRVRRDFLVNRLSRKREAG